MRTWKHNISAAACLAAMVAALTASTATADTIVHMDEHALSLTNWTDTLSVPKFNGPGTLNSVLVEFEGAVEGMAQYENLGPSPATVTLDLQAILILTLPDTLATELDVSPMDSVTDSAAAFDTIVDFGGASGGTFPGLSGSDMTSESPGDLSDYTGAGTVDFPVESIAQSMGSGSGNLATVFVTNASAKVTVTYDFTPAVAIPEPSTFVLIGLGMTAVPLVRRRRNRS